MSQLYTPANLNQAGNAKNPFQGNTPKALCVCSAGLLRSPTIAKYLTKLGYNTRACGTSQEYALIPLSEALMIWCDSVHVVEEQAAYVEQALGMAGLVREIVVLGIPDIYETFSPDLELVIKDFYENNYLTK